MSAAGSGRVRLAAAAAVLAAAGALLGCGQKGNPASVGERASDEAIVNTAIGQEMTLVDSYRRAGRYVRNGRNRALLRKLLAQEQEHIDGWTKAMRGLGGQVDAEAEALDYAGLESERDYLLFVYRLTGTQLTHFLDDVPQLSTPAPQSFAASIAAGEAQHLVVLRQALGAGLLEAVPDSFDTGEVPPPAAGGGARTPGGGG
jgi:hypothetical protein